MIAPAKGRSKAASPAALYHLEVVLNHVKPQVRRRLVSCPLCHFV